MATHNMHTATSFKRRRHIHKPTEVSRTGTSSSENEYYTRKPQTAPLRTPNKSSTQTTSLGRPQENYKWHKNLRWEEFDILAKGITNEDIASTTTGLTLPTGLR